MTSVAEGTGEAARKALVPEACKAKDDNGRKKSNARGKGKKGDRRQAENIPEGINLIRNCLV